jgi:hypothetical protein
MSVHAAVRPDWTCAGCGLSWPCATRRRQLTAEYIGAPTSLMVYLAGCFVEACEDMPHATVGGLYARFLLWPRSLNSTDIADAPPADGPPAPPVKQPRKRPAKPEA